jgi:transcriptional regulator with XRE-family HTH domain
MQQLIAELRARQEHEGLTQQQMADKLGFSQATLSRLYAGKQDIGMESLQQILRAYPELSGYFLAQSMGPESPTSALDAP